MCLWFQLYGKKPGTFDQGLGSSAGEEALDCSTKTITAETDPSKSKWLINDDYLGFIVLPTHVPGHVSIVIISLSLLSLYIIIQYAMMQYAIQYL